MISTPQVPLANNPSFYAVCTIDCLELRERSARVWKTTWFKIRQLRWPSRFKIQDVQVFGHLVLCFVHCLLVWECSFCLPPIGSSSFDLKSDYMEEVSWYIGQRQVNLSINDVDVQPKVFQGTHKVSSG